MDNINKTISTLNWGSLSLKTKRNLKQKETINIVTNVTLQKKGGKNAKHTDYKQYKLHTGYIN